VQTDMLTIVPIVVPQEEEVVEAEKKQLAIS
jgi:hypothetical protein